MINKIRSVNYWWFILIVAYVLSLPYFLYEWIVVLKQKKKRIIKRAFVYFMKRLKKCSKSRLANEENESAHELINAIDISID